MKKNVPKLAENKTECCGCAACYATCPQKAIDLFVDDEGFCYPRIKEKKCVMCYKCVNVCPILKINWM